MPGFVLREPAKVEVFLAGVGRAFRLGVRIVAADWHLKQAEPGPSLAPLWVWARQSAYS
jgi:hypothetical protein